jgi:hypothetical protein
MRILAILIALTLTVSAQTKPAPDTDHLPIKRVVLYKNGVGYFEHVGKVRGTQDVNIDFTTSQLDDVLKSLTIVDYGDGRVTGVRYNSTAPLDQRLRGLRIPLGENPTREQLLNALRGARVDVRNGSATASGKILSVETRTRENSRTDEKIETTELSIITDAGELRTFELNTATSVRIADRDLNQELARYMSIIGSSRAKDVRRMTLSASGTGERDLLVSYVSEVPIWKTTYRIVIPPDPKKQPLLQGWAVVDNTIGEDWKDVKLSLVAGAPQSFVQQISTPFYARRPVIALPETAQLSPQTHEAGVSNIEEHETGTLNAPSTAPPPPPPPPPIGGPAQYDRLQLYSSLGKASGGIHGANFPSGCSVRGIVTDPSGATVSGANITVSNSSGVTRNARSDSNGMYCLYGVPAGTFTLKAEFSGFSTTQVRDLQVRAGSPAQYNLQLNVGSVSESVEVSATRNTYLESQFESAGGREIGELFSYDIKQPITIGKDQSALVPIVQARVEALKVTIWNADEDVPRDALWLRNTSGATLDSGSFSIIEGDSFAGEGLLDPIKPNERRLLSYAGDSSIHVTTDSDSEPQPISHVRIIRGLMTITRQERSKETYTIRNTDKDAHNVVIEHPVRNGWKFLDTTPKPEETSDTLHRFLIKVDPNATAKLGVAEYHPLETTVVLSNLTSDDVLLYSRQRVLKPEIEDAFRSILNQKNQIAGIDQQIRLCEQEVANISNDQARVRENMKALKGSAEEKSLVQRYATQMNQQEDRLIALRTEIDGLRTDREKAQSQLTTMLMSINFDEEFAGQ